MSLQENILLKKTRIVYFYFKVTLRAQSHKQWSCI